jgi:hypothetical protein
VSGIQLVGVGVLVTFLGVTTLLPLLSRVLARVLGAPLPGSPARPACWPGQRHAQPKADGVHGRAR